MLAEKIDALDDTVLTEWKSLDTVVTGRAERLSAAIAIYRRYILAVISTIHYFVSS
jgi:hypothetical protein